MTVIEYAIHRQQGNLDGTIGVHHDRLIATWEDDTEDVIRLASIDSIEIDGDWWTFRVAGVTFRWEIFAPAAHAELRVRLFPDDVHHV